MNEQYIICWKSKATGYVGHGDPISKSAAQSWVDRLNKECPEIFHWMVKKIKHSGEIEEGTK